MAVTTARALVSDYNNFCIQGGLDPTVLLSYTCVIPSFGGANNATFADFGAAGSHATNVPSIALPWDCMIVGASVKYINAPVAGGVVGAGSTVINAATGAGSLISIAASFTSVNPIISLTNAEMVGQHFSKSVTGLTVALSAGTMLAVGSVNTAAVDDSVATADLLVQFQIAVPQSKFALPTTQS
jgi:hypothetical protein